LTVDTLLRQRGIRSTVDPEVERNLSCHKMLHDVIY